MKMNVVDYTVKLSVTKWLEKQIIASKKLAYDSEEILGRKDGFSEISSMLNDISTVDGMKFESALKEAINSYRWQIKNQKMEDSSYSHGKIRAYLATLDYIQKNNK